MLVRVALGRQIKERQGWVDQAEPRRFLVSLTYRATATPPQASALGPSRRAEVEPCLGTLEEVGATGEGGYLVGELTTSRSSGTRRTETHAHG